MSASGVQCSRFGSKLESFLRLRGKSQSGIARETGISQSAISAMIGGRQRPFLDQAFALARALSVPVDFLADDAIEEPTSPLGEREQQIQELIRELGPDRAWRRLVGLEDQPATGGYAVPLAIRDLTESDLKREREARAASKRKPKGLGKP